MLGRLGKVTWPVLRFLKVPPSSSRKGWGGRSLVPGEGSPGRDDAEAGRRVGSPWHPAFSPNICFHKGLSEYSLNVLFLARSALMKETRPESGEISGRGLHCVPELIAPPSAER